MRSCGLLLSILFLSTALLATGCGHREGDDPTAPHPGAAGPAFLPVPPAPFGLVQLEDEVIARPDEDAELEVGNLEVKIRSGSVATETVLRLRMLDPEAIHFVLEPAGLVLMRPAEIKVKNLDHADTGRYGAVAVYRKVGSEWVRLAGQYGSKEAELTTPASGEFAVGADGGASAGTIQFIRWLSGEGFETVLVEAQMGGKVELDRFEVTIPKGALAADTYITIRDPGDGYVTCELEPHGLQFLAPVELEIDLEGLDLYPYSDWTVFWFNEGMSEWDDIDAVFQDDEVTVGLWHFSTYRPGRAGW